MKHHNGFIMPRFDNSERLSGYRACVPSVPGCVIILQDYGKASAIMADALKAIVEEEAERIEGN